MRQGLLVDSLVDRVVPQQDSVVLAVTLTVTPKGSLTCGYRGGGGKATLCYAACRLALLISLAAMRNGVKSDETAA